MRNIMVMSGKDIFETKNQTTILNFIGNWYIKRVLLHKELSKSEWWVRFEYHKNEPQIAFLKWEKDENGVKCWQNLDYNSVMRLFGISQIKFIKYYLKKYCGSK